jgi:FkbM family methyltransferase
MKVARATLALRQTFRTLIPTSIICLLGKKKLTLRLVDGRSITLSRRRFLQLVSLSYFHSLAPYGVNDQHKLVYKGGIELSSEDSDPYLEILRNKGWSMQNGLMTKNGIRFSSDSDPSSIFEVFEEDMYNCVVDGREVVDVGAGFGDSSLYFAYKGAKRVLAIEPIPMRCEIAHRNLKWNPNFGDKITICMASVLPSQDMRDARRQFPTKILPKRLISLDEILEEIEDPYLLKMDCEGCEFDLVARDYAQIKRFENLIFEYHVNTRFRPLDQLLRILDDDFVCTRTYGDDILGVLKCSKR